MYQGQRGKGNSVLDYGLIDSDHVSHVTSFVIDSNARFQCGSDHALLQLDIEFKSRPSVKWKFHDAIQYNFNKNSSFDNYKYNLDKCISKIGLRT